MALTQQDKDKLKATADSLDNEVFKSMLAFIYWIMTTGEIKEIWKRESEGEYDADAEQEMIDSREYLMQLANERGITRTDVQNSIRDYANYVKEQLNQEAKENLLLQGMLSKEKKLKAAQNWLKVGLWIIAIAAVIYLGYLWYQGKLKLAN